MNGRVHGLRRRATSRLAPLFVLWALAAGALGETQQPEAGQTSQPGDEQLPRFTLREFRVEGNKVLPALAIETAIYPMLGPRRTIRDVEKARDALEKAYREQGYLTVLVDIPEQKVKAGVVTLRVTEGKIGRLSIKGNRYYSRGAIREKIPSLAAGSVPNFQDVQNELTALSRNENRRITPTLMPGKAPGTVDAELKVEDRSPFHAELEVNNRQTPSTEPLRLQASVRLDNLWQREHSASFLVQTAPQEPNSLQVFSATYLAPIGGDGTALAFYGVHSNSDITAVASTNVVGRGGIIGSRGIIPLRSSSAYSHSLAVGVDYKDFSDTLRLGADNFETPISYVPLSLQYRMYWQEASRIHAGNLSLNGAPRGLLGNNDQEFANKRFNARASYLYLRGSWSTEQRLSGRTVVRVRLDGQLANGPLISNEEFVAGGAESVRGYLEAERLGDNGAVGSIEVRQLLLGATDGRSFQSLVGLAFLDAGALQVIDPLPGQINRFDLASAGVGLRARMFEKIDTAVDVAVPFTDGQVTTRGDPRVHFRVSGQF
jgi:hemolysin activation/secretion protein